MVIIDKSHLWDLHLSGLDHPFIIIIINRIYNAHIVDLSLSNIIIMNGNDNTQPLKDDQQSSRRPKNF